MKPIYDAWFCQIELTSRCHLSCLYCSRYNKHLREDQKYDMTLDVLERALDSLKDWPTRIGIIGGEPILHSKFTECCELIQSKFPKEKMGLWTSGGKDWPKYKELANNTFGFIAYNEHNPAQKKVCRHQRLTVAVKDVIEDKQYMDSLIDDCWVQRSWCPTISMKGAFFCEVAAAQDLLWDGPGGYPIEPGWWRKVPSQFVDQRDRYCQNCGMCVPMDRDLIGCGIEQVSKSVYNNMVDHNNRNVTIGKHIELFGKHLSVEEVESNKMTWYPGNYRGDSCEDEHAGEGRGSTVFRVI
jgi:hypothetical protein